MDKLQKVMLAVTALMCTSVIAVTGFARSKAENLKVSSSTPAYDEAAVKGVPEISDQSLCYSSLDLPLTEGSCKVSLAAAPKIDGNDLDVYFTNSADSTVGIRLVIYDENQKIVGQSGIIKSGEYVETVELSSEAAHGQQLRAKILTYEAETFYSVGSATATLMVI